MIAATFWNLNPRTAHDKFIFFSDSHDFSYTMEGEFIDLVIYDFVRSIDVFDSLSMIGIGAKFFSLDLGIALTHY
jgi:hypothetical protein